MKITIKRVGAVLLAVLILASAAVGVSADNEYMSEYTYVAYDSYGIIYLSKYPLSFFPSAEERNKTATTYRVPYICVSNANTTDTSDVVYVLKPVVGTDSVESYYVNFFSTSQNLKYSSLTGTFSDSVTSTVFLAGSGTAYNSFASFYIYLGNYYPSYSDVVSSYKVTANYAPLRYYYNSSGSTGYPTLGFGDSNFTVNPDLKLSDLVSGGDAETIIISINAAIESMTNTIINTGSDYIQFIPSQAASDLDSSVSSINSAESALSGASSSLMDSVSSEWTANKNTAKTFLTTITPTANEIKNVYTTLTAAMPDEVLALFAIIPLILFIGYLIGRVR